MALESHLHSHNRHICRFRSLMCLLILGLAIQVPTTIFGYMLLYEFLLPTLGDDGVDDDDLEVFAVTNHNPVPQEYVHPGYAGTCKRLCQTWKMAADGLCLYYCLAAATQYDDYLKSSEAVRATMAQQIRSKTIELLAEYGMHR